MNRCEVGVCGGAAWTMWLGHNLCKDCSAAAWVWESQATTQFDAANVIERIAKSLRDHGSRSGPEAKRRGSGD
jgi:hypothetical protein